MPAGDVVVSNTSPLLNLALVDRLELLRSQFETITVPRTVRTELLAGDDGSERLRELLDSDFVCVTEADRSDLVREFRTELDEGEADAIALAIEHDADLLLDDERERRQVARRHGVTVTGVVGILLRGARGGEVDLERALDELRDVGFWIGDELYRRAIDELEESE